MLGVHFIVGFLIGNQLDENLIILSDAEVESKMAVIERGVDCVRLGG